MLSLNLVSQKLKEEIKLRHIYKLLLRVNFVLVIATIFIAIIILVAKIILQNNFNKVVAETTLITKDSQGRNFKIREINAHLNQVASIQSDFIPWSFVLEEIAGCVDDDIVFYFLKLDRDTKLIELRGRAGARQSLLVLKEGMQESEMISDIDFPLKNILEKSDIDFIIKAHLNLDKIKID